MKIQHINVIDVEKRMRFCRRSRNSTFPTFAPHFRAHTQCKYEKKQQKFETQNTAKVNVWLLVIRNPYKMHMLFHWHKYNIQHHRTLQMFLFSLNAKSEFLSYERRKFTIRIISFLSFSQLILSFCSYFALFLHILLTATLYFI